MQIRTDRLSRPLPPQVTPPFKLSSWLPGEFGYLAALFCRHAVPDDGAPNRTGLEPAQKLNSSPGALDDKTHSRLSAPWLPSTEAAESGVLFAFC